MIKRLLCVRTAGTDPYENLAVEELLLDTVGEGECILYLWQNDHTVVIGRNQNVWKECRVSVLEQEGGHLARRLSGGGAVYHDLGNLNFTFLMREEDYDLDRQLQVIETACRSVGLSVERSGRNDVLAEGRKFSGNAFYHSKGRAYHHGTLLVDTDGARLSRYLSPSKAKLQAKGVDSVRSRVVNLAQLCPGLTCGDMARAMEAAFGQVYGLTPEPVQLNRLDGAKVAQLRERNASADWLFGPRLPLSMECEKRFDWGGVPLQLQVESGVVTAARVYTDAMEWQLAQELEQVLTGSNFSVRAMCERIQRAGLDHGADLCALLTEQEL